MAEGKCCAIKRAKCSKNPQNIDTIQLNEHQLISASDILLLEPVSLLYARVKMRRMRKRGPLPTATYLCFFGILALASVGFSSFTIGNTSASMSIDATVGSLTDENISRYVSFSNKVITFSYGKYNDGYAIVEDGKVVYSGDISVSFTITVADGLYDFFETDSSGNMTSMTIGVAFTASGDNCNLAQYFSAVSISGMGSLVNQASSTNSTGISYGNTFAYSSTDGDVDGKLTIDASSGINGFADMSKIATLQLTLVYSFNFQNFDTFTTIAPYLSGVTLGMEVYLP